MGTCSRAACRVYAAGDTDLFDGMAVLPAARTSRCCRSGAGARRSARPPRPAARRRRRRAAPPARSPSRCTGARSPLRRPGRAARPAAAPGCAGCWSTRRTPSPPRWPPAGVATRVVVTEPGRAVALPGRGGPVMLGTTVLGASSGRTGPTRPRSATPLLFGGVLLGSIVPVVPTGAVVGAAAAVAITTDQLSLHAGAAAVRPSARWPVTWSPSPSAALGGPSAVRWVARGQPPERLDEVREQFRAARLADHRRRAAAAGRADPGAARRRRAGLPVAAAGAGRRARPALLWAVAYALLGVRQRRHLRLPAAGHPGRHRAGAAAGRGRLAGRPAPPPQPTGQTPTPTRTAGCDR